MRKLIELKIALFEEALTQRELASQVGINPSVMSLIVNGRYNPHSTQRKRIAEVLNRAEGELFPGVNSL